MRTVWPGENRKLNRLSWSVWFHLLRVKSSCFYISNPCMPNWGMKFLKVNKTAIYSNATDARLSKVRHQQTRGKSAHQRIGRVSWSNLALNFLYSFVSINEDIYLFFNVFGIIQFGAKLTKQKERLSCYHNCCHRKVLAIVNSVNFHSSIRWCVVVVVFVASLFIFLLF